MNRTAIFARTAKGDGEVTGATRGLPWDLRRVLDAIDGKAPVTSLRSRLTGLSAAELDDALATLASEDFIYDTAASASAAAALPLSAEAGAGESDDESWRLAQALRAKIRARRDVADRSLADAEAQDPPGEDPPPRDNEAPSRLDAATQARQQAAERARQDAEEQARRDAEDRARRELAEIVRQEDAAQADRVAEEQAWREAEDQARRTQEEAARKRADARAAKHERKAGVEFLRRWGKPLALGVVALLVSGLVLVHLISFDGQIPAFEKALAGQFRQPVKIEALRLSLLPQPHLRLERVSIGGEGQIRIPGIKATGELRNLFRDRKAFTSLQLDSPLLNDEGLGWILFGNSAAREIEFGAVSALNLTLVSKHLSLPASNVTLSFDGEGSWKTIVIESLDKNLSLELTARGESVQFDLNAKSLRIPFGSALTLEDLLAKGTADRAGLAVTEFKGFVYGGTLSGNATLKWGTRWSLAGQLKAKQIDAARLLPELLDGARIEGAASYAMQAPEAAQLFAAPRLEGSFVIPRGTLLGVDLGRVLQGGGVHGDTVFTDLGGSFVHERGATQLRQLRLNQGSMSANGMVDVDAERNVRGRLALDLKLSSERLGAKLALGGTLKKIEWRR